jgi:N-acetylglucosamine-6-phosphate deacetylase
MPAHVCSSSTANVEGGQTSAEIAQEMAAFISKATSSVHLAAYDCRLDEDAAGPIRAAIQDRLSAGVDVRR